MLHALMTITLVASYADRKLGYELARRFGFFPALGIILVLYGVPYLIIRAMGGKTEQEQRDDLARRQEESEERSRSGDGPPRFNG